MEELEKIDQPLRDLIEIIHFTESVSAKIHGLLDEAEIYRTVKEEFAKSKRYNASIFLLTDDGSKLRIAETSLSLEKVKAGEKTAGLRSYKSYSFDLNKSSFLSQVVKEGKTIEANFIDVICELFPKPLAYLITKIIGYEKRYGILTPLKRHGKIIGVLVVDSTELAEHFVPSVRNLSQHISTALELADIHAERERMEKKLRGSEERYKELTESITDVFFAMDKDLRYTYWNKASEKLTGTSAEDAIGKSLTDVFPDVKGTRVEQFYLDTLRMQQSQSFVNVYRLGDKDFVFEINAYPTKDGLSVFVKDITERKKAEEELIRLSSAVKMSTDSVVIGDLDAKIIDVNEATLKMYGTDDKMDLIGKNSFDLITPEDREKALVGMQEVLEKGYVKSREYHIITKDGSRIPVEMNTAIMKDADGKPIGFVSISRAIKERKMMEEKLRESEEKWRSLVKNAPNVILIVDRDGKIQFINRTVIDARPEEIVGRSIYNFIDPEYHNVVKKTIEQVFQTEEGKSYEISGVGPKGNVSWYETQVGPIKHDGQVVSVTLITTDITERKQMEEKLRQYSEHLEELVQKRTEELLESEKRYSVLVEEARDGVVMLQDEKLIFTNNRLAEIIGYSRHELIGMPFEKLVDEKYRQQAKERHIQRMRGEKVPATYEVELIAKTGERVPVEVNATRINYQGRPAGLVIVRDVRERKRMEEERFKLEKLATMGELATMVGHDLRNPLQAITNAVYVLKNTTTTLNFSLMSEQYEKISNLLPEPILNEILQHVTNFLEDYDKMICTIDESVKYANKILSDLQEFARTKQLELTKVNLEPLIQKTLSKISIPKNVKVSIRHDKTLSKLYVDPNQISRVFTNLTTNAIQAMPNGGKLTISTSLKNGFASIAFQDAGVGIPKEDMKKLFTPLFTTKAQGVGLGLSICKNLVEAHGGTIEVESKEGKGSTFTVKLPIQQQTEVKTNEDK